MPLIITKNGSRNFSHSDGFKTMNFSNWDIIFDETAQTVILQLPNGAPFPKTPVPVAEATLDGDSFATTSLLRAELVSVGYNPLVASGTGGGAVESVNNEFPDELGDVNLTTQNIPDSTNKRYVTDSQLTVIGNTIGTNTGDQDLSGLMVKSQNLNDVADKPTARTNLDVYSKSEADNNFVTTDTAILTCAHLAMNMADNLSFFFGVMNALPLNTTDARRRAWSPLTGNVIAIHVITSATVASSSQNCTLKLNNKTTGVSTTVGNIRYDNVAYSFSFTGLTIAINQNDNFEFEIQTPTLTTNPTACITTVQMVFQK